VRCKWWFRSLSNISKARVEAFYDYTNWCFLYQCLRDTIYFDLQLLFLCLFYFLTKSLGSSFHSKRQYSYPTLSLVNATPMNFLANSCLPFFSKIRNPIVLSWKTFTSHISLVIEFKMYK